MKDIDLVFIGILIIITGFILVFLASILAVGTPSTQPSHGGGGGNTSVGVGGCIIIFFIPICFGAGTPGLTSIVLTLAIVLSIILVILFFIAPLIIYRRITREFS